MTSSKIKTSDAPAATITLFSAPLENLNLFFPILLFAILGWEILWGHIFTPEQKNLATITAKVFFLNHIHIYFSFALVLFTPEMQSWARSKNSESRWFLPRWGIVFLGVFVLFFWGFPFLRQTSSNTKILEGLLLLTVIVGLHHNYSQSLGLSIAYNHAAKTSGFVVNEPLILRLIKLEKVLFLGVMTTNIALLTSTLFGRDTPPLLLMMMKVSMVVLVVATVAVGLIYPREFRNKKIFMLRYILFALTPISFTALVGVLAIHGVEYFCVFRKMSSASALRQPPAGKTVMTVGTVIFIIALSAVGIFGRGSDGYWNSSPQSRDSDFIRFLIAFATAAAYLHYHVDSFMFRMRDPLTRAATGSLLFENQKP